MFSGLLPAMITSLDERGAVGIPVLIYSLPLLTGIDLSPSLVARVASQRPNLVGLKDPVISFPSCYAASGLHFHALLSDGVQEVCLTQRGVSNLLS